MAWRSFEEARAFVHSLGFKKSDEFKEWAQTDKRPLDIPTTPRRTYSKEWKDWPDWLGTDDVARGAPVRLGNARPFHEARAFVRALGLPSSQAYEAWSKTSERPLDIPATPRRVYKDEWDNWADWLGKDVKPLSPYSNAKDFLGYSEAREFMRQFDLKSSADFEAWKRSGRPKFIPASPRDFYKAEYTDLADFLGFAKNYRPFLEAREFVWTLGLKGSDDWTAYTQSSDFPSDLPVSPSSAYDGKGWQGLGDFIGFTKEWNRLSILAFLESLKPVIDKLSEADLYLILARRGILKRRHGLLGTGVLRGLTRLRTPADIENAKEKIADEFAAAKDESDSVTIESAASEEVGDVDFLFDDSDGTTLRTLKSLEDLKAIDQIVDARISDDTSVIEFMVRNRVSHIWQKLMECRSQVEMNSLVGRVQELSGGRYFSEIKDRFLTEFDGAMSLPLPENYSFQTSSGVLIKPNPMQCLTAFRLLHNKRCGNWSGVGAGKTMAAVLAAGVARSQLTLVIAANPTVQGWGDQITRVLRPDSVAIHEKEPRDFEPVPGKMNFLVINYESLQQSWSEAFVRDFTEKYKVDFVVLDEVQLARQRRRSSPRRSKRRDLIESLIAEIVARNSDARILAMSATPVVNNLVEAIKLLELMLPEVNFDHVSHEISIPNALNVHMLLREHGIRFVPQYDMSIKVRLDQVNAGELVPSLLAIQSGDVAQLERALLPAKLKCLSDVVRRGTLIYTHYVTEMVEPIIEAVENLGLRTRQFTGESRIEISQFVKEFQANQADVLVGSASVGTGVDGLQFVLNRLVFISLPWSSAEYEQIVGRLWRQGSDFQEVEIIIPQVVLRERLSDHWSWDEQRLHCIKRKRTLADAVLDGTIPLESHFRSKEELQKQALVGLQKWIDETSLAKTGETLKV